MIETSVTLNIPKAHLGHFINECLVITLQSIDSQCNKSVKIKANFHELVLELLTYPRMTTWI